MVEPVNRIACVHLYALPLERAFAAVKAPKACAVRTELRGRKMLIAVSDAARAHRIQEGMTETEARARLPELKVRDHDPAKELSQLSAAAELLFAFGPVVEICPPTFLYLEIGRSKSALARKLRGADEKTIGEAIVRTLAKSGHQSRVVIAKDPDTGRSILEHLDRTAKRTRTKPKKDVVIVPPGEERRILARLPVSSLLWTDPRSDPDGKKREALLAAHASLAMLGIEDVARLQTLPASQVGSRFGEAGSLLMQRAKAERDRPLEAFVPSERLVEELELERETDDLEPILFLLKRLFDGLEARLDARGLSATALDLTFVVEPGIENQLDDRKLRPRSQKREEKLQIRFARATRRAGTMLRIAKEKLGGSLPGRVRSITVEASSPEKDRGAQLDLFTNHPRRVEEVGELVGRLIAALGEQAVFSPQIRDTHRPEAAWGATSFDIERAFQEPPALRPKREHSTPREMRAIASEPASLEPLPELTGSLEVTGRTGAEKVQDSLQTVEKWPKPIPRKPEDEPIPELPPRPLELLATPEPASIAKSGEAGILRWRGQRLPLVSLSGAERLECEWWSSSPVARDYVVAEANDGRRYWLFYEPSGRLYVHGIFD
jgi:protein ImuB